MCRGMSAYIYTIQQNHECIPSLNVSYCTAGKPLLWKQFPLHNCVAQQPRSAASRSCCQVRSDTQSLCHHAKHRASSSFLLCHQTTLPPGQASDFTADFFSCQTHSPASKAQQDLLPAYNDAALAPAYKPSPHCASTQQLQPAFSLLQ